MAKNNKEKIKVAIGTGTGNDGYNVTLKAGKEALKELSCKPDFALIYADSNYDEKKILKAGNELFGDKWAGGSTDTQLTSKSGYQEGAVTILVISSEYLHFGVGVSKKYHKNPTKEGEKAIKEAMKSVKVDQYVDPYIQFRRAQTKSYEDIVKIPPYFILSLICGVKYDKKKNAVPGMEAEFIEGIFKVTGPNVPIIGGSTSTDFKKYAEEKITNNYQFANGKLYYDAAILVFVVSSLYFSHNLNHGYLRNNHVALITKVDKTGHIIEEINNKPAVEEYARIIGISVNELIKNPFKYILAHPMGFLDSVGNIYIKSGAPNPDKKTWYTLTKVIENSAMIIVDYDEKKTKEGIISSINEANILKKEKDVGLALIFSCCGRKALLSKDVSSEIELARKKFKKMPLFGFHSFGEIGAKMNRRSQVCNQSVSSLIIYNRLLTE